MSISVDDIKNKQFDNKLRGYNPTEVDKFLEEIASTITDLENKNRELADANKASQQQLKYFTELKDSLNKSILVAQEAADKVKNNAKREAEITIREAQKQATDIVSEANDKANQVVETSANDTRKLTTETNDLKKQTRIFRQRLQVMLESQLEVVKSDEWDSLLANDDLSKYDEIQKILGSRVDKDSDQSVESSTPSQTSPVSSTEAHTEDDSQDDAPVIPDPTPADSEPSSDDAPAGSDDQEPTTPADGEKTVVIFPDDDDKD